MAASPEQSQERTPEQRVRSIVADHRGTRGALLPVLHAVKEELGYVDPAVIPVLATELNLSRADVYGVITFYEDFRQSPPGRTTVRVCRAEACQAVGAVALADRAKERLGVSFGETSPDGAVTLDQVFCFGNCATGPAVEIDGRLHGRVTPERLDALLAPKEADE
jgi:formate dehydrogenase subunit gamma